MNKKQKRRLIAVNLFAVLAILGSAGCLFEVMPQFQATAKSWRVGCGFGLLSFGLVTLIIAEKFKNHWFRQARRNA